MAGEGAFQPQKYDNPPTITKTTKTMTKTPKKSNAFTLVEVIVSVAIIAILVLGIYSLILLSLRLTADNKYYVEAIEIANQKIEQIRNLPYDEVGVVSGIPSGNLPQVETISRDGDFIVNTYVTFYDDPYDGVAGVDPIINDYKIVSVKVGWQGKFEYKNLTVFSKIIPRTEETAEGYGLLKILVSDANASPLADASVRVINNALVPTVDVTNPTDASGILYLPALESFQGYEIIVTRAGYGTDQSYDISTSKSPSHLSVTEGDKTEEAFSIDVLGNLQIRTVSNTLPDNWRVNQPLTTRDQVNASVSSDKTSSASARAFCCLSFSFSRIAFSSSSFSRRSLSLFSFILLLVSCANCLFSFEVFISFRSNL